METRTLHSKVIIYTLLTVLAVLVVVPFFWMLLASVKTSNEVFSIPMRLFPKEFQWGNYQTIWDKIPLLTFFKNTFKIAVLTTLLQVFTSCFAAYGFSKVEFKGRDILFLISVTTFAVPWQAYMVPQFALISRMGLTDSHLGLILMQAFSGFGVFLIRQFMIGVPNELLEAARIDGLSEYGIFAKVALPLVKPGIATLVIFTFVTIWNDFMGPLIYLNSTRLKTIQLGIRMFISQYGADYALIMAASVCSLIPVLVVFMVCQKWFVEGITAGGVKG
ncbi:carbohydrate ABC transporter permease [Clostridiales bacterium TF09-2AC]|uniref:carbohydrate ABC transporter permease n=1 Tax=Enterocloster hominis (ex Hitch et al. 2024) TaxID=1917870 RepID=UPI000E74F80F|nr:carbohydrate ABC transporter permease [Lachnoclostridium pacaense]MCC2878995.1 carbohydrate ABC transporter permease [Lachnoclostridium pacaense]RJW44118.1 carbohydrate ABC transporter permease [Clostridiales bacterium TF09-2AC]